MSIWQVKEGLEVCKAFESWHQFLQHILQQLVIILQFAQLNYKSHMEFKWNKDSNKP